MNDTACCRARLMFDPGSGICLWSADDRTRARYGYPIDHSELHLSQELVAALDQLIARSDRSINWSDPGGPSTWESGDESSFRRDVTTALERLRQELGSNWSIDSDPHRNVEAAVVEPRLTMASLPDRENVVAEVWLDTVQIAEVSNESGTVEIELLPIAESTLPRVPIDAYIEALARAKPNVARNEKCKPVSDGSPAHPREAATVVALEVVIASLPDRNNMVAEIWYGDLHLAEVSNEHGTVLIELSPIPQDKEVKLSLEDYMTALTRAGKKMDF